jgi:hypothetical protein
MQHGQPFAHVGWYSLPSTVSEKSARPNGLVPMVCSSCFTGDDRAGVTHISSGLRHAAVGPVPQGERTLNQRMRAAVIRTCPHRKRNKTLCCLPQTNRGLNFTQWPGHHPQLTFNNYLDDQME